MDESSQKELQRILSLHESELLEEDLEFVKARRMYLTRTQRKDYSEIFTEMGREDGNVFLEGIDSAQVSNELRPRKEAAKQTEYQDKDVRLNLDQAAAPQQPQVPVQPEVATAPVEPAQSTTPPQAEAAPQQPAVNEVEHSLDPDFQPNQ